jgi:hypothetical protein
MERRSFAWTGGILVTAAACISLTHAKAGDREFRLPSPVHYQGLLNDYTPSNAVTTGGPYEMRGKWSLEVDERRGTAKFSAAMNMETSDFGIVQGTVDKDIPMKRGAHTHHLTMTDGMISDDWATVCPVFSPVVTDGFVVKGTVYITGNGGPASFGNPTPITICVLGGTVVKASNITVSLGMPASKHFGTQPIHGVVLNCTGPWEQESRDCKVEEPS